MQTAIRTTAATSSLQLPAFLVSTSLLEQVLNSPGLRVFDCAVIAGPNPDPELGKTFPFAFESGREKYDSGHIPGAGYIDILGELSDKNSPLPLMLPVEKQFVAAMSKYGIGESDNVVLYSSTEPMWAARVWWMLRAFGFDNTAILNGGWTKWVLEDRPVSQGACNYLPGKFAARPRPEMFVSKDDVLGAIGDETTCVINALPQVMHAGAGGPVFGRKGRIVGSTNVPNGALHDPDTGAYLSTDELRALFSEAGAVEAERIITYCGGGIASSNNAFALALLGHENVGVYDASMFEWGNDPSLPMEAD
jgi:thiosulfate/3-mercaptopyruvate sulfurtransferase